MEEGIIENKAVRLLATISLALGVFMFVLDYTVANVAIPYIAGGLATSVDQGTYVLTFFTIGNSIILLASGYLASRFGNVTTLLWAVFWFTIFSMLCGFSKNLFTLVVFRFLQGAAAGPILPISQALLKRIHPPHVLDKVMATFAFVTLGAPVLGPIVGGYFCVDYTWPWIFYINLPVGIFCFFVDRLTLKNYNAKNLEERLDFVGFLLLFVGITALQLFLDKGQTWDWFRSPLIKITFTVAVVSLTYLLMWCLVAKRPLIKLSLFRIRNFTVASLVMFFFYATYFGCIVVIPLWLQTYLGYDALRAGIAVAPLGVGALLVTPFVPKIVANFGRIVPLCIGFLIMTAANFYTSYFYAEVSMHNIMLSRFYLGLGISFIFVPLLAMPVIALPNNDLSSGLGVFHFIRGISGAIGTSIFTTLFYRRTVHHHHDFVDVFNYYNPQSRAYMHEIESYHLRGQSSLTLLNDLVDQQASALTIEEISFVMAICCFTLCFLVLFGIERKKHSSQPIHHVVVE